MIGRVTHIVNHGGVLRKKGPVTHQRRERRTHLTKILVRTHEWAKARRLSTLRCFHILISSICPWNSELLTREEKPMLKFPETGEAKLVPLLLCSVVLSVMKLRKVPSIETATWCQFCSETEAVDSISILEVKGELNTSLPVDFTNLSEA